MKKIFLVSLVCSLILIEISYSALIEVGIKETVKGNISSINYDNSSNIVNFLIEFYNTGSVPYKTRIKAEIFDNDQLVFNAWSQEKDFMPGDKKSFDIYWFTNKTGKYFVELKTYFGNEIKEYKKFGFLINKSVIPEDVFEIEEFRTYDNYVIFHVKSRENVKDVIVMPKNYISGWIFEQKKIGNMTQNSSKLVVLPYYPTLWSPTNVTLAIASNNGRYYTEKTVEMKKYEGLVGFFYYIIDMLRIALFS